MAVEVPLTRGLVALIDDTDAPLVLARKWYALAAHHRHTYAMTTMKSCPVSLHRFLLQPGPRLVVDHINRNGLDNRRENLRMVTHGQNLANRKRSPTKHGFIGVGFHTRRRAYYGVIVNNKHRYFTTFFRTAVEAARAWDILALQHHDERFIELNFPAERQAA